MSSDAEHGARAPHPVVQMHRLAVQSGIAPWAAAPMAVFAFGLSVLRGLLPGKR